MPRRSCLTPIPAPGPVSHPRSLHTPHLDAISTLTDTFRGRLDQLQQALDPEKWVAPEDADAGSRRADPDAGDVTKISGSRISEADALPAASPAPEGRRRIVALASQPSSRSLTGLSSASAGMDAAPSAGGARAVTLREFFRSYIGEFTELSTDLRSMHASMEHKASGREGLWVATPSFASLGGCIWGPRGCAASAPQRDFVRTRHMGGALPLGPTHARHALSLTEPLHPARSLQS